MKQHLLLLLLFLISSQVFSQSKNSTEIYHDLEKLKSPYRVLYLAAHPDDENTRLISYFANEIKARTAYLSLTRGDGGQNLIGKEKGALLGVLRTEELLAARRIDGGEQFFSRAVDFGYSKTSEESFEFWGKENILSDVVYILRFFKPHIIVNRFPSNNYSGHGHHHASALLSALAFDRSNDPEVYSSQIEDLGSWQVGTLYHNSSSWWDKTLPERAKNDFSISEINVGEYNSSLGFSYNELAAFSRSQHKSQGFGSAPSRGEKFEYLEYLKGTFEPGRILHEGLLDSIDKQWFSLAEDFDAILNSYDHAAPSSSVEMLIELRNKASALNDSHHRFDSKIQNLEEIILNCLGFSAELIAEKISVNRNETINIDVEVINRSELPMKLEAVSCDSVLHSWNRVLDNNIMFEDTMALTIAADEPFSNPYWLDSSYTYRFIHDQSLLERPVSPSKQCIIDLSIAGNEISIKRDLIYKWTDRVKGGLIRPIIISPRIGIEFDKQIYFPKDSSIAGNVVLKSNSKKNIKVDVAFENKNGINIDDLSMIDINSGSTSSFPFKADMKSSQIKRSDLSVSFSNGIESSNLTITDIKYDHIQDVRVLTPASARIVPIEFKSEIGKIAYVEGPDNEMIEYLKELGCDITSITEEDMVQGSLDNYKVLLFGIRSINVNPNWDSYSLEIQDFIKKGGLVIVQYQTRGLSPLKMSPYSFEISRKRVTDENSSANITKADHRILSYPYKLTKEDFNNWNQERGLYFADNWEEKFTTVISWHDKGEFDQFGSLIIGDYGKGAFIYTGISFFRHIPYGVPGSYKLFLNILSYSQN